MVRPSRRNIVLIGYRGTGKSSVARAVAARIKVPCLDTDELVASAAEMSIAEVFEREGEAGFRQREAEAVTRAVKTAPAVISAGGGVVENEDSMRQLKDVGCVVWLTARPQILLERIEANGESPGSRPDLTPDGGLAEAERVLARRAPLYRRWADLEVSTESRSVKEAADEIVFRWTKWVSDGR